MVFVPAGSFVMGAASSPTYRANADGSVTSINGDTRHTVALSAYCISKFHITNAQYKAFCDEAGSAYRPGGPSSGSRCYWDNPEFDWTTKANHPVLWVGYNNAVAYCDWVSRKTGWSVSLPSEAQWERAARGQTATGAENLYPWGNTTTVNDYLTALNDLVLSAVRVGVPRTVNGHSYPYWPFIVTTSNSTSDVSNYSSIAHGTDDSTSPDIDEGGAEVQGIWKTLLNAGGYTTAVGAYPASAAGCYDMAGNAYQWTRDYFSISYYVTLAAKGPDPVVDSASVLTAQDQKSGSDGSIINPDGQPTKIVRGGSWYAHEISAASHHRTETRPPGQAGYHSVGFRVVAVPQVAGAAAPAPAIAAGGVVSAASGAAGISPGSWVSIYGTNLAATTRTMTGADAASGYLPTTLGGVSVKIDGKPAFVYFVSPTQINVLAPDDAARGAVPVVVTNSAGSSSPVSANLQTVLPALFAASGYAARPGDALELYGTGFGPAQTSIPAGTLFSGAYPAASPATATIGGAGAPVLWCGLIGPGLYQINIAVPSALADGDYPLVITIGGSSTQAGVRLRVRSTL
jgi:uncharacterized protein (TIGR03437 family)